MIQVQGTSSTTEFEKFENRRKYPRISLDVNASLLLPGKQFINVTLHDISVCALQARFDAITQETIRSALQHAGAAEKHVLGIQFRIKLHDKEEEICLPCTPVYICELEQNVFAMGLQFSDVESRNQTLINKFIEVSMEPL